MKIVIGVDDSEHSRRAVETVPRVGYRFVAPVEPIAAPQLPAPASP